MIKVEKIDVFNFDGAIRGMRNPLNSWDKSDSFQCDGYKCRYEECPSYTYDGCDRYGEYVIGKNDLDLMRRLYKGGSEHRKYLRHIFASMDITAPLYWWKEFDTYKFILPDPNHLDTNSCSTMHKIHAKEFELEDFSTEHLLEDNMVNIFTEGDWRVTINNKQWMMDMCDLLNGMRKAYLETKDKDFWWQMIQLLPASYNQKRTITMSYENVVTIIKQRSGHKLDEWNELIKVLRKLPYIEEIMGGE